MAWCLLVGLAIRKAPVGKWAFAVLGLLPTAVFHGAAVSADGVTLGVAFLFLAFVLHLALTPGLQVMRREWVWLLALGVALACVKPGYAPLALTALAIPLDRFPTPRARRLLMMLVYVAWGPPGDDVVRGFGGRYLLPIAPLLLFALPRQRRVPAPSALVVGLCTSLGLLVSLSAVAHRYYGSG